MVQLQDIVDCLSMQSMEEIYYFDRQNEEFIYVCDGLVDGERNEKFVEEIEEGYGERFIALPSTYEIDAYGIMVDYIDSLSSSHKQAVLSRAIQGRGTFRRFKDCLDHLSLLEDWYRFENRAYQKIALDWCREQDIRVDKTALRKI